MPLAIDVTGANLKIQKALDALSPQQMKVELTALGLFLLRIQRIRIEKQGKGSSGKKMPGYSPTYALFRKAKGRTVNRRTLSFTAQMLGARGIIAVKRNHVILGWRPGPNAEKALGNEIRTPFAGATKLERKQAVDFLARRLLKKVKS